ncbi:MAG: hypothetical protein LBV78_09190 [Kitasatospora sp.]|jgi:hypothetical protein|nr:hypothetical protein [Kitasatospora sp.]
MRIKTLMTAVRRVAVALLRVARRFGSLIAEMDRQQRRLHKINQSIDHYLPRPDVPPETYREFLARTRGTLLHEPNARARLAGHAMR